MKKAFTSGYLKPKGDFSDFDFDIEILVNHESGFNQSRIIRNCKYNESSKEFEEYGTGFIIKRRDFNFIGWKRQNE